MPKETIINQIRVLTITCLCTYFLLHMRKLIPWSKLKTVMPDIFGPENSACKKIKLKVNSLSFKSNRKHILSRF